MPDDLKIDEPKSGAQSYDEVPYRGNPFRQTHPESIATVAHLLSLPSPDIRTARVLELGCCDGGNLIPMALDLPNATFVGIDYSSVQINLGRADVKNLGIANLDLRDISILDVGEDFGEFDYIISHGVFSWVPDPVAEKMLDICAKHLSPRGVAYLSYNTLPGWYMREPVRDMMRYHALRFDSAARRIHEARLLLDFVAGAAQGFNAEAYGSALRAEAELLKNAPDHYIYHEHLEDFSRPYYFHELIAKANARGIDFLAESRLAAMATANFSDNQQRALGAIATNVVELEQFMDFLRNRTFRETLLHRAGEQPKYEIGPDRLAGLYVIGMVRTNVKIVDLRADTPVTFSGPAKVPVTTTTPVIKAALVKLMNSFPLPIRFENLLNNARAEMAKVGLKLNEPERDANTLAVGLLKIFMSSDLIEFSIAPPRFTTDACDRPVASAFARYKAADPTIDLLVTRRHDMVRLDATQRKIMQLLDGTRTASQAASETGEMVESVLKVISHLERSAMIIQ